MSTREVTNFKLVWIGRSDGELELKTKKHGREYNGPSDLQLDKNSSEDDYYELLNPDDESAIYWKASLGETLREEMGIKRGLDDVAWILADFPENYRLYRHVKKAKKEKNESSLSSKPGSSKSKKSKVEECYLYGYPYGRKQRFHTPKEFFPHLWWLCEGKSDEHTDCECKHCCPPFLEDLFNALKPLPGRENVGDPAGLKKDKVAVKQPNVSSYPQNLPKPPQVVIKQRSGSQDSKMTVKPAPPKKASAPSAPKVVVPAPNTSTSRPPAPNIPMSTPLPAPKSFEQELDAQVGRFLYHPGELTWFNRGTAWGLSVVIKRDLFRERPNQERPRYLVQPLSHPFHHPSTKIISSEDNLRPWLAWSAPSPTHQTLLSIQNLNYSTVDWKAVIEGRFGTGDVEVDGSIFAAKMIDDSFSLIEQLTNNTTTTGERSYNGLYLGGEKIWVGEAIRLRIPNGQLDIMIVHQIIEKLKANSTNAASATIHVVGDLYRYNTVPFTPGQEPAENPHLPIRLRQDLNYRNRFTIASKRTISHWKLMQAASRITITDIKGRWYESSVLLPILHGVANFRQDQARGDIADVGAFINGRGDANGAPGKAGTRYKDRLETFGRAVPAGTKISHGLDSPIEETNMQAVPAASSETQGPAYQVEAVHGQAQQAQSAGDGDIAEFMDLDYVEQGGQFQ